VPIDELEAGVQDELTAREALPLELRCLLAHDGEDVLIDVVELSEIVRLGIGQSERVARDALIREIPGGRQVQVEGLEPGDDLHAIDRGLCVVVVAIPGVEHHAEAPVEGHAAEADLTDGHRVLGPGALDPNAVLRGVHPRGGRCFRLVIEAE
jgi:hypothetical protein